MAKPKDNSQNKSLPAKKPRIEEWFIGSGDLLFGKIYGHAYLPDGAPICTNRIVDWDHDAGIAKIKNSDYTLGQPRYKPLTNDQEIYTDITQKRSNEYVI